MAEIPVVLKETFDKIALENNFVGYDVQIKPISSDGANYSSQLYLAKISSASRSLNLFAKVIVLGDKIRSQGMNDIFDKEPFVYTKLSKFYHQLEEKHNVPKENRFEFPKFYGENPSKGQEVLVLEDLVAQGYSVYDRFKSVDWPYAFKAVKELAKLHALSFALEYNHPEEFKKMLGKLKFIDSNDILDNMMVKTLQIALNVVDEKNRGKLEDYFKRPDIKTFAEYMKPLRHGVIIHGDFRVSNLMHRIDEDGVYQIKTLDYQGMHLGSPVIDLLYFIFTGTDEDFRTKHYLPLLEHYYSQLSLSMCRLGLKPSEVYSREEFDFELEENLPYGLVVAVALLPIVMVEVEDAPTVDKDTDFSIFEIIKVGKRYPERLNGIVNDYVRWRVL